MSRFGGKASFVCVASVALTAGSVAAPAQAAPKYGKATYYTLKSGGGNCSYPKPPASGLYVALGPAEYRKAAPCGGYLLVKGPKGSVRVKIVDQCPECAPGHLDLSRKAFARIGAIKKGIIPITYRQVVNPKMGPLKVLVKKGSSRYWMSAIFGDHGNPLTKVRSRTKSRAWKTLVRRDYNAWEAPKGMGTGPYWFELTDNRGHRVVIKGIRMKPGVIQTTKVRMYR